MKITSLKNDKVKYWVNLKNKKFRDQEKVFLVEGDHLISEAKKYGEILEYISITDEQADYFVTKEIMQKISSQKSISNSVAVVKFLKPKEISSRILILDNLQDPGNLGTIIRSAVAFNFTDIILSNESVDIYNSKVIRATEGMLFKVNVLRKDIKLFISELKEKNYQIVGTDVENGKTIKDVLKENVAIIIGNEGSGVRKEILDLCDFSINLKMNAGCESLNAGVCASIIMYEVNNG